METKQLTYHLDVFDPEPKPGEYIVYCGKKGVSQVNLIRAVRKIKHKEPRDLRQHYRLTILPQPHLKELTEIEEKREGGNVISCQVWVRGEWAWPSYWIPRKKK